MSAAGFVLAIGCSVDEEPASPADPAARAADGDPAVRAGRDLLLAARGELNLDADTDFVARGAIVDDDGETHVRFDQLYRGVRVWEGEVIVHAGSPGGRAAELTSDLKGDLHLDTTPALSASAALQIADRDVRPIGPYATPPTAELVIYPHVRDQVRADAPARATGLNAVDMERVVTGYSLAYYVQTALENGAAETRHADYIIDAHSGTILKQWDSLQTATGYSQYSGAVSLNTNPIAGGWELRDLISTPTYATYNYNHAGPTTIYTDLDNVWGDGLQYSGGSTTSDNGQTAAVDAHYGAAKMGAYYRLVHNRTMSPLSHAVHYSTTYCGAFVSGSTMYFGDGDGVSCRSLTSLDVVGHEWTHTVIAQTANLTYSGESGGLNESIADIHGTMVEFYARGGSGSTIGNTGGTWTMGEQPFPAPIRYLYKPSLDGASPDAWYSGIGGLDVHYSSGPSNRMFYFLSQGASSTPSSVFYSSYRPCGMTGVGNDHAARIAYRALAVYMTSSTNYAAARTAYLAAASDLYGVASADYAAVKNAFSAINVGAGATNCNLLLNPGFESGAASWTASAGVIGTSGARTGSYAARLDGYGTTHTDSLYQQVTIPATYTAAQLCFYLKMTTAETTTTTAYDTLKVQILDSAGTLLATLATFSNLSAAAHASYVQHCYSVGAYAGLTVRPSFLGAEDIVLQTSFFIDDTSLQ